ncbi:hypothetical protein [Herbaspirillum sp. RV1423]|uniref:hypothetical protein n=1 Tax=Herbaspirillum sp. RV1423 TaxID=1443993 RepID=UPI001E329B32|nr:hypothetical protein [Herbaspirillum sp. RV1423]
MTTHSTVFQQSNTWKGVPKIFDATGADLREMNCAWSVMDALGIRNSDISQSNGIIWVEGPSDRMYIKHWLHLFCKLYQKTEPKENIDYSFCFYGGALLSHMSAAEEDSLISMLKMNRNMIVVMDRDFDFSFNPDGVLIVQNSSSPKVRILNELKQLSPARLKVWITDGYTMESYLPASFRSKYFAEVDGRLFLHKGRKVEIASKYMKRYLELGSCTESIEALTTHIEMLHTVINQWNL